MNSIECTVSTIRPNSHSLHLIYLFYLPIYSIPHTAYIIIYRIILKRRNIFQKLIPNESMKLKYFLKQKIYTYMYSKCSSDIRYQLKRKKLLESDHFLKKILINRQPKTPKLLKFLFRIFSLRFLCKKYATWIFFVFLESIHICVRLPVAICKVQQLISSHWCEYLYNIKQISV